MLVLFGSDTSQGQRKCRSDRLPVYIWRCRIHGLRYESALANCPRCLEDLEGPP